MTKKWEDYYWEYYNTVQSNIAHSHAQVIFSAQSFSHILLQASLRKLKGLGT